MYLENSQIFITFIFFIILKISHTTTDSLRPIFSTECLVFAKIKISSPIFG